MNTDIDPVAIDRGLRRKPLFADAEAYSVQWRADEIERMLPHRRPMRLVEGIDAVDLEGGRILAHHDATEVPFMQGHFPGNPILPGVIQNEMVGQAGLCLWWLTEVGALDPNAEAPLAHAKIIHVLRSSFLHPVRPGDHVRIAATHVVSDPIAGVLAGQILVGDQICSTCVLEVYFG